MAKIRYISLFSGIEAWSCAVAGMPEYEAVAFSEIDPFACAVLKHHYPDVPNLGDITKVDWSKYHGEVDLIVGGSPCFVAGTPVLTPSGYRPIEEIAVGDEVVSADGNVCRVEAIGHKTAHVGRLKILGRPEVVCTPEHPFLCFPVKQDGIRKSPTYGKRVAIGSPAYVPASEAVGTYSCRGSWREAPVPELPDVYNAPENDIMEMAGWYVGDGYIRRWDGGRKQAVVFSLVNERKVAQFRRRFPYAVGSVGADGKVTVCCTALARWLTANFGELAHGKRIPYWLYMHPCKEDFLKGYIATDGEDRGSCFRFTTVSKALAYGIADLGGKTSVEFCARPRQHVIEGRIVNQKNTWTASMFKGDTPRTKWFFNRWTSIVRSWTQLDEPQTVYNITVEGDHTYVASGFAVHNCQGFSQAGYRKGLRDSRSSLALSYVQAVERVQPRWLLWENVPGVLSTNDGEDFRCFLAALDDLGFGLAWAVLDSQWFGVAQRRRRVFVVGHLGSWQPAAQVLFERSCLQRNPPPRRKAGQGDSRGAEAGAGNGRLAGTLCASGAGLDRPSASGNQLDYCVVDCPAYAVRTAQTGANGIGIAEDSAHTLDGAGVQAVAVERERETVACETVSGALCARDYKSVTSTIDGKLIAVRRPASRRSPR